MALAFARNTPVESRRTGRRGWVAIAEFDEFFHTLLYKVRFDDQYGSADWWFKAADLKDPSDKSNDVPVAA